MLQLELELSEGVYQVENLSETGLYYEIRWVKVVSFFFARGLVDSIMAI